ncbi:hypothetical protein IFM89_028667 [Coptis chinensis]|uniref:PORR domain-containing protein n=1 Tax=Coptis chinensis TaxID=261450 RepID=A0A835H1D9_9MAGN|nr:hypothetical protein IFM89_028667 [Coptis chinensis]
MAFETLIRPSLISRHPLISSITIRFKTTSAQYVDSRTRDPTYEKLMKSYKNLLKVYSIQDLILANPKNPTLPLDILSKLAQKLHLNRGALSFLRKYPHIFTLFYNRLKCQPFCKLTETAAQIVRNEALAVNASKDIVVERLVRLLLVASSKELPLRAIFKVWRELGLPDDFEKSVIAQNPDIFILVNNANEPNTHILKLVARNVDFNMSSSVENWRREECGPYEEVGVKKKTRAGVKGLEKRAVGIVHEFLSLTVEKMVEVEKISHFRKWFGIDLNIRDLFLDHPGIFYLSTKGNRHMVFLREAYERGCLIDPNPVYDARRKLLDLVIMGRRGILSDGSEKKSFDRSEEAGLQEDDED